MAYFMKRGNAWQAQISWYGIHNERKYKTKSGFPTKRQAKEWANKMEVAKSENAISNKDPIFAEYFRDWYTTYKTPNKSRNTKVRYNTIYKKISKEFGSTKLSKINRHSYQAFMNKYGKTHAKDTVYKTNGTIRTCVSDAVSDGIIHINFTNRINLIWNSERTRKIDYLNYKELQELKDSLLKNIKPSYISRYMLITAIYTGMRPGEIDVLTWKDIDFKHETININKSFNHDKNKIENYDSSEADKSTKNTNSVRIIKLNKEFLNIISNLKQNNHSKLFIGLNGTDPIEYSLDDPKYKDLFDSVKASATGTINPNSANLPLYKFTFKV